ncbi:MAG: hypothetical protein A2Y25_09090 [Candidatus Melainabacteria bacterium GWF2_37_15]|nr:MAG: hypothetical protein A2Y25_09090 [Candidatus Melainabacteria bacterium GWF2_37_15]
MELKDHKEGTFLEIINQLEVQGKKLKPKIKGYILIAMLAVEMVLIYGYGRTKEEIIRLRQQV